MKNMQNNKSPGNDGLSKVFYEGLCDEIKELLIASAANGKHRGELSISQRQTIIKLIEKRIETKHTLKIGDSFLYLILTLSERLKSVLSCLNSTR